MDAKSPKNAVDGWMNDGLPKYYSGMNDGVPKIYNGRMNDGSPKICSGWMVGEFTLGFIIKEIISCVIIACYFKIKIKNLK
jgi:hypothetical protein